MMSENENYASFEACVLRAQQGDNEAFDELFRLTYHKQWKYAQYLIHDSHLAEDVIQDVYIKLYQNINRISSPKAFNAYLSRMTYNECITYKRKRYYNNENMVEDEFLSCFVDNTIKRMPEEAYLTDEKTHAVTEGLKSLNDEECFALVMHYYENMNVKSIAEALSVSPTTVKRRLRDGRKKMAIYLTDREMRGFFIAPAAALSLSAENKLLENIHNTCGSRLQNVDSDTQKKCYPKSTKYAVGILSFIGSLCLLLLPALFNSRALHRAPPQNTLTEETTVNTPIIPADTAPPEIITFTNNAVSVTVTLSDESGIDSENIYIAEPNGKKILPATSDPLTGTFIFPLPEDTSTLYISDTLGNTGTAPIDVDTGQN